MTQNQVSQTNHNIMISQFQKFEDLHHQTEPLLLRNVWSAQSTKVLEKLGYKALGTSSYAVAEMLGYEDGGEIGIYISFGTGICEFVLGFLAVKISPEFSS